MSARQTSRDYRRPHRPRPVALLERALEAGRGRPPALEAAALIDKACRATGLSQFDGEPLEEPLTRLCRALELEAQLTWTGRALTQARLVGALTSRLRVEAYHRRFPEIGEQPVAEPLFVTGLQRTGTTLLHRLLAVGGARRALASWEALTPAKRPGPKAGLAAPIDRLWGGDARKLNAHAAERTLAYLAPDFFAVHPVQASAPEEEVVLMDHSFISQVSEASYHVPSYAQWVEAQDHRPAYRYLRRCLQLLQWERPRQPRRWVLKSPVHLEQLDALLEVFPDARVVQTHRDPHKTVASFCSMVAHGRGVFSDVVEPLEIGSHWLAKVRRMVERAMAARARRAADAFLDVHYRDLIADPLAVAARVSAFGGIPMGPNVRAAGQRWLRQNRQHKHGQHVYDAADFGITPQTIDDAMGEYMRQHALVRE
jgi:Sulfotransferase family